MKRFVLGALGILAFLVLLVLVVPYGRANNNPPVIQEPAWDSAQTRALFARACSDGHSNETVWRGYAPPLSWLFQYSVDQGRAVLNVSEWPSGGNKAGDVARSVEKGTMPPEVYVSLQPEARLAASEQQAL